MPNGSEYKIPWGRWLRLHPSFPAKFRNAETQRNETAKSGPGTHRKGASVHAQTIPRYLGYS